MGPAVDVFMPLALAYIMFTLGTGLGLADFRSVTAQPRNLVVGLFCQAVLLPLVAFLIILVWPLEPALAMGVMVIAAAPGGVTSNLLTAFGRGEVALSVALTTVMSLVCAITVPPILWLSHNYLFAAPPPHDVSMAMLALKLFAMATVPVLIGMAFRHRAENLARRLEPPLFRGACLVYLGVLGAAIYAQRENLAGYFAAAGLVTLFFNVVMFALAELVAQRFATGAPQRIAIMIECGIQNGTLAIAVATMLFGGGPFVIPAVTYSLTMLVTVFGVIALLRAGHIART